MSESLSPKIRFENHLTERVVEIIFESGFECRTKADLELLKKNWTENLKKWHSPYTCLFDCRKFNLAPELESQFAQMIKFFGNFFMKKIVGFVDPEAQVPSAFPFEIFTGYENAAKQTGLSRAGGLSRDLTQLRSRIQIDNDFNAHVMEISFLAPTEFANQEDINTLKDKIKNILKLWHSPYSLVFNLQNCTFSEEGKKLFAPFENFLRAFFCKAVVGYAPTGAKDSYPFPVYRARHKAVGTLEHEGLSSGATANCSTRKTKV